MSENLPYYSLDELSKRNGKLMSTVWIAYQGKIYDVSSSELFKNGKHYEHEAGKDLTAEMADAPHWDDVMENFPVVGLLK